MKTVWKYINRPMFSVTQVFLGATMYGIFDALVG